MEKRLSHGKERTPTSVRPRRLKCTADSSQRGGDHKDQRRHGVISCEEFEDKGEKREGAVEQKKCEDRRQRQVTASL